jgi:hypothetical protein
VSTYSPREGVFVGRPPCANCGANLQLHTLPPDVAAQVPDGHQLTSSGLQKLLDGGARLRCPTPYRPGSVEDARRALEEAERSGDAARIFTARGDLQRLVGRK